MDPKERIAALVAEGRLEEAARLCADSGEAARASELYERACCFAPAAVQALRAGALGRAMQLATLSNNPELQAEVMTTLSALPPERVLAVAADLAARGREREAGTLLSGAGATLEAAQAFERAGAVLEAARSYDRAGKPADAARVLEAALRAHGRGGLDAADLETADEIRATLGQLYARHGRHEPAVRVLQQIAPSAKAWPTALPALASALAALGLSQALRDLEPELRKHGVSATAVAADAPSPGATGDGPAPQVRLYGRYEVRRDVASTPHARVLEALDVVTGESVAIKIFASRLEGAGRDALQRFVREARALAELRHSHVVPLRDYVPEGPALVLPWMAGGSLRDLLDREPISPARAAEIGRSLLSALGEAHRLGILHRDVKPSNLLFDAAGTPMLADFGAAHLSESAATVTAAEIGTVAYMAPEQVRGLPATVQSDLYSAGVLLYEMLTGKRPGGSCAPSATHPDLDARHDALLGRLLAPEQEARFADAEQARRALDALPWSTRVAPTRPPAAVAAAPVRIGGAVLQARLGPPETPPLSDQGWARRHDSWLGRDVIVLPLDELSRARAAAFARASHPALPAVLRADAEAAEIWIAPPRGAALRTSAGGLGASERARLEQAIAALHRAGGAHGCIDDEHVFRHAGAVTLGWPRTLRPEATAEEDRAALNRLR